MDWTLLLLFLDGSLFVVALLVVCWKYVLLVAAGAVALHLAARLQEKLRTAENEHVNQ